MAILKKIRSATLVEVMVATVLIVIIFVVASLILNNLLLNTFSKNTHGIENKLNELEYEIHNGTVQLPYEGSYQEWKVQIRNEKSSLGEKLVLKAINQNNNKEIIRSRINAE